ncbi:MAG: VWA domain-containing protein, partial [Pontixanthobacter sp.]
MSAPVSAESGESIVVTGSRLERRAMDTPTAVAVSESEAPVADRAMPGYPTLPAPPRRQPPAQSGLLTAGEHDDLLNPELYAEYVRKSDLGQKARDVPLLDTSRVLTVEAKDRRGRPMPFVPVEIRCADGSSIALDTVADGRAVFFPGFDLRGDTVDVRAGDAEWRRIDLRAAGGQTIGFTMDERAAAVRKLDLSLVVDVTGSMADELRFLQAELTAIVDALNDRHSDLDIRVGFTFYRDQGDAFVTRTFPLDGDMA